MARSRVVPSEDLVPRREAPLLEERELQSSAYFGTIPRSGGNLGSPLLLHLRLLVLRRSPVFRRSLSTNCPRWGTSRVEVSVLENQAAPSILPCSICSRLDTKASCGLLQDCGIENRATVADPRSALALVARRGAAGRIRRASVAEQLSAAIAAVTLDKHPWTLQRFRRFCSRCCLLPGRNI